MIPPRLQTSELARHLRHVALDLYERDGFESVTADQLAVESGVNRRSLFRYFATLEDVLFSDHHMDFGPKVEAALADADSSVKRTGLALMPVIEGLASDADFARRRHRIVAESTRLDDREALWFRQYQRWTAAHLSTGVTRPKDKIRAEVGAAALVAALVEILEQWYADQSVDAAAYFRSQLAEIAPLRPRLKTSVR